MSTGLCHRFFAVLVLCVVCVLLTTACTMRQSLGRQGSAQQKTRLLADDTVVAYVSRIGGRMAKAADRPNLSFHVLDSSVVSAYAVAGGRIFVARGLLERMDSEAQLAGLLAHEIGHHIQGATAFGSEVENQCDRWAVQLMAESGYDPRELVRVMEILGEAAGEAQLSQSISYHHPPETRIKNIEGLIRNKYATDAHSDQIRGKEAYEQHVLQRLRRRPTGNIGQPMEGKAGSYVPPAVEVEPRRLSYKMISSGTTTDENTVCLCCDRV